MGLSGPGPRRGSTMPGAHLGRYPPRKVGFGAGSGGYAIARGGDLLCRAAPGPVGTARLLVRAAAAGRGAARAGLAGAAPRRDAAVVLVEARGRILVLA